MIFFTGVLVLASLRSRVVQPVCVVYRLFKGQA